jgi:hypothetical protein
MSDERLVEGEQAEATAEIDPLKVKIALERLRSRQNLAGGVLAGAAAALVGAAAWAIVTFATGYQIGWMAVGVGFLVGFAVRTVGHGVDKVFGVAGGLLALLGCGIGNLLTVCAMLAAQEELAFLDVLSRLDPRIVGDLMQVTFSPIDLLFYGIAVYEGYKLSFHQVQDEELDALLMGR